MTESEDHGGAQEAEEADPGNAAACYKRALLSALGRAEKAACESASRFCGENILTGEAFTGFR